MNDSDQERAFRQTGWPGVRARLFHLFFLLRRPMTLGVRGLVYNRADPYLPDLLICRPEHAQLVLDGLTR